eukprot:scaffold71045_cov69-Phaeocystis_antarctica.AAC.1
MRHSEGEREVKAEAPGLRLHRVVHAQVERDITGPAWQRRAFRSPTLPALGGYQCASHGARFNCAALQPHQKEAEDEE